MFPNPALRVGTQYFLNNDSFKNINKYGCETISDKQFIAKYLNKNLGGCS